jgi:hypothetical protein
VIYKNRSLMCQYGKAENVHSDSESHFKVSIAFHEELKQGLADCHLIWFE